MGVFSAAGTIFTAPTAVVPGLVPVPGWVAPALGEPVTALGPAFPVAGAPFDALAVVSAGLDLPDPVAALVEGFPVGVTPFGAFAGVSARLGLTDPVAVFGLLLVGLVMNFPP